MSVDWKRFQIYTKVIGKPIVKREIKCASCKVDIFTFSNISVDEHVTVFCRACADMWMT